MTNIYEPNVAMYTGTKNLYERMIPAMKSLIANSNVDKVILGIEHDKFPIDLPDEANKIVEVMNLSGQKYFSEENCQNWGSYFTYMAMIRAAYWDMFPQYKRILSVDVDTFVNRDISSIWDLPIYDYYFAAVKEPKKSEEHNQLYCNVGVCLFNLEKLRDGTGQKVMDLINSKKMFLVEQDAFNFTCKDKIYEMPPEYNAFFATKPSPYAKVVHFAAIKDWTDEELYKKWEKASWDEVFSYRKRKYGK